ncbi:Ig-like domain-containing protein [Pseudomonas sp. 210_17 TE3656]
MTQSDYQQPYIEGYSGDQLDPGTLPAEGVKLVAPPANLSPRDYLYFCMDEDLLDWTRVPVSGAGAGVKISVAKEVFTARQGKEVTLYFQVSTSPDGARTDSAKWHLILGNAFEGDVLLDLSSHDYVVSADKPPKRIPDFARLMREASGGVAPYRYASSAPKVATVDDSGQVTGLANGVCEITATDRQEKVVRYKLTVKGIRRVHFVSPGSDWAGIKKACEAAGLVPVSLNRINRLWNLYKSSSDEPKPHCVGEYLGYMGYDFWTADDLGAGTARTYDLNGSNESSNAGAVDKSEYRQVMGMDPG